MPSDPLNMDDLNKARRKAIEETIRSISVDELRVLGEGLFPQLDHPWRDKFFGFVAENANATFHHAMTDDGIHIIYCHAQGKGMWFVPGSGMGPMQATGLKALKEIVEAKC